MFEITSIILVQLAKQPKQPKNSQQSYANNYCSDYLIFNHIQIMHVYILGLTYNF